MTPFVKKRRLPTLSLMTEPGCHKLGDTITVTIAMTGLCNTQPTRGGQYFLAYDATALEFVGAAPDPNGPFPLAIYLAAGDGTIDYATGVDYGAPATTQTASARSPARPRAASAAANGTTQRAVV